MSSLLSLCSSDFSRPRNSHNAGLISQVAEELWEVKNKKIRNLTREDISIVEYKKLLMKDSASSFLLPEL